MNAGNALSELGPDASLEEILGAAAVYAVLVMVLKVITKEDCSLLPKGEKIARILRIS